MQTTYSAVLSANAFVAERATRFPTILACVKWAEAHEQAVDCCDIYSANGNRIAQYRKPPAGSYSAQCGVWINAKIA